MPGPVSERVSIIRGSHRPPSRAQTCGPVLVLHCSGGKHSRRRVAVPEAEDEDPSRSGLSHGISCSSSSVEARPLGPNSALSTSTEQLPTSGAEVPGRSTLASLLSSCTELGLEGLPVHPSDGFVEGLGNVPAAGVSTGDEGEQRRLFLRWAQSAPRTKKPGDVLLWVEVVLKQLYSLTHGLRSPDRLRVAVCCLLLDTICEASPFLPVGLQLLKGDLYNAIYLDYRDFHHKHLLHRPLPEVQPKRGSAAPQVTEDLPTSDGRRLPPPQPRAHSADAKVEAPAKPIEGFIDLTMCCSVFEESHQDCIQLMREFRGLQSATRRSVQALETSVEQWKKAVLRMYFLTWHAFIIMERQMGAWLSFIRVCRVWALYRAAFVRWRLLIVGGK
eukprot:RCo018874